MDPNQDTQNLNELSHEIDAGETVSVDDFIKELEAKEKDLHITADTTIIEIEDSFDYGESGEYPDVEEDGDDTLELLREAASVKGVEVLQPAAAASSAMLPRVDPPTDSSLESVVSGLRDRIAKMEAERDEMFKSSQRRARDLETLKTRTERERKETFQSQVGNLATQMLPALDNLNRALDFARTMSEEKSAEFDQFFDGIVLVLQQVNDVFARMGVTLIPTVGHPFDPQYHEAVATEINDDLPANTISEELLRGYKMGEKIIRHSMVKVSQTSGEEKPPEPPNEPPGGNDLDPNELQFA